MSTLVEMRSVSKAFGEATAISDVSLTVESGEIVALLGHNGAGKTVTVRLMATLSWPTRGSVRVSDYDTRKDGVAVRQLLGLCLDQPMLWPDLTGYQTLRLLADAYGVPWSVAEQRCGEILERFRQPISTSALVSEYSLGMKRKLGLAMSLLHEPRVVVWDEPEIGLDAPSRVELKALLADLRRRGCAIVVTTHAIELAESVASRIAVLGHGRLVACDTAEALRRQRGADSTLEQAFLTLIEESYVSNGHRNDPT